MPIGAGFSNILHYARNVTRSAEDVPNTGPVVNLDPGLGLDAKHPAARGPRRHYRDGEWHTP